MMSSISWYVCLQTCLISRDRSRDEKPTGDITANYLKNGFRLNDVIKNKKVDLN